MKPILPTIAAFMLLVSSAGAQHCRITVEGDGSTGSGTLVRKTERIGTILTCAHLFSDSRKGIVVSIAGRQSRANLVRIDKENDLAVLEIAAPPCDPFPVGPDPKGELTAGGFGPNNELRFIRGSVAGYTSPPHRSTVINGMVRPGDSGGGVFDDQNRLVGVVWGCRPNDGQTYATCGEPVRAILAGVNEMACYGGQCYQGNCYGGQCGPAIITGPVYQGQVVRPPAPPQQTQPSNPSIPSPPPAPTPSTPIAGPAGPAGPQGPAGKDGKDADQTAIKELVAVNVKILAALEQQKPCQCDSSKLEAKVDAIAAAVANIRIEQPKTEPAPEKHTEPVGAQRLYLRAVPIQ